MGEAKRPLAFRAVKSRARLASSQGWRRTICAGAGEDCEGPCLTHVASIRGQAASCEGSPA
jgi:hypothetical protein